MVDIRIHYLPPTKLVPNSPWPLLHYPAFFSKGTPCDPARIYKVFESNGWESQWIFQYGPTQRAHYHSQAHECMAVLSGSATIRFGVADTVDDLTENTYSQSKEEGGIEIQAHAGDVFVLPAGLAHKTFQTSPEASFTLLTKGDGHGIAAGNEAESLGSISLSGFTMIGAYPNGSQWDFVVGDEELNRQSIWTVPKPCHDPVLGQSREGLCGLWCDSPLSRSAPKDHKL